jgi:hypothetical protein
MIETNADERVVPRWIPRLFVVLALALAPWIAWLLLSLPRRAFVNHWEVAWAGFDVGLAVLLAGTGIALIRRSPLAQLLAAMAATLLLADAWFDTMTARGASGLTVAVVEALLCELPLALVCLWIARSIEPMRADARPFLKRAGFRIERRRPVAGRLVADHDST